eukprot:4701817-Prymnesium_polylepis.1
MKWFEAEVANRRRGSSLSPALHVARVLRGLHLVASRPPTLHSCLDCSLPEWRRGNLHLSAWGGGGLPRRLRIPRDA